mmetsp:Transcript_21329/g.40607  ORF Transcript_21329/g.40607 Transcript_21329/m.40607 type:complete len:128 (-) Transcript_21329:447-830(-)|eukprot:CAMPEP_0114249568 /NCGR_PEP_ID=MMETSP0058-20121206/14214_1 /TAXON_ID=36894 /ORGANISM="Pyramimonas parkeae, CCMP726" /LENGTH=127 /DNA_ID=CAMNT_0001363127 /DNA_START=171 /DNA_END=554 /DNA_ORIENTATION=-
MGDVEKWVEDLLGKLTEEKFLSFLEDFTESHCGKFEEGEQKLEYTEIHQQYARLYESRMEAYLKKQSCKPDTFAEALKAKVGEDPAYAQFLELLIAVEDYQEFCRMMIRRKRETEEEEKEDDEEMSM